MLVISCRKGSDFFDVKSWLISDISQSKPNFSPVSMLIFTYIFSSFPSPYHPFLLPFQPFIDHLKWRAFNTSEITNELDSSRWNICFWWLGHSEKYESVGIMTFHIVPIWKNQKCYKPPTIYWFCLLARTFFFCPNHRICCWNNQPLRTVVDPSFKNHKKNHFKRHQHTPILIITHWFTCILLQPTSSNYQNTKQTDAWILYQGWFPYIFLLELQIPSGKHTNNYWKWWFIVDLPINSMVMFHRFYVCLLHKEMSFHVGPCSCPSGNPAPVRKYPKSSWISVRHLMSFQASQFFAMESNE